MGLLEGFLEFVYPTRCAGCDMPGSVLCDECIEAIVRIERDSACPRCGAPYGWLVCTECWERELAFTNGLSAGCLEHPLSRAVTIYKDGGERRLAPVLASLLAHEVEGWAGWPQVVTYVPATLQALRRRGFDHAWEISRAVAELLEIPHATVLGRSRARDQRSLGREDRFRNACGSFTATGAISGRVLLVDDVLTTGATLDDAARTLLEAGADEVRIATVARAW